MPTPHEQRFLIDEADWITKRVFPVGSAAFGNSALPSRRRSCSFIEHATRRAIVTELRSDAAPHLSKPVNHRVSFILEWIIHRPSSKYTLAVGSYVGIR